MSASSPSSARLDSLFEAQADATPEAIALWFAGRSMTYRELDRRANRLADHLSQFGAGPEVRVGVCLPRSFDVVIAMLGILKAGAAYVPLDPRHPAGRLDYMLQDSAATVLIAQAECAAGLDYAGPVVDPVADAGIIANRRAQRPASRGTADDLAYVIYTSGSTGAPKGVMLAHTASNLVAWAGRIYSSDDIARVAATTSITFDPSVLEIFAPLCLGGSVIIKAHALEPFAVHERPTMLSGAPSVLTQLARDGAIPDSVRVINVGGETVRSSLIEELYRVSGVERIYNHYGPTEATTCTTAALIERASPQDPPIGRPIDGAQVHLLDDAGDQVAPGAVGEIHIAGSNLARGYLNLPALTTERFVRDPFAPAGGRMYRTGDLGRWSAGGELEFLGRRDHQVKLSGIRVELGEIEATLLRVPDVRHATVMVTEDAGGAPLLTAFLETDLPLEPRQIRQNLNAWLPPHMVPSAYVFLRQFPLAVTGKIDRAALLAAAPPPVMDGGNPAGSVPPAGRLRRGRAPDETGLAFAVRRAWQRNLPRAPFDPDQTWAEAGGNSLRMMQLMLRLEQTLGRELEFDLMSADMTPRDLESGLTKVARDFRDPASPTVHLIPGVFGDEPILADFRRAIGTAVRFEVVKPPDLEADAAIIGSVTETGRHVAGEIARRQPTGAIRLAGYSYGGAVAFEAAAHLQAAGRAVEGLAIFDTATIGQHGVGAFYGKEQDNRFAAALLRNLLAAWSGSNARRRILLWAAKRLGSAATYRVRRTLLWHFRVVLASQSWRPTPTPVPTLVAVSDEFRPFIRARWADLAPLGSIVDVPATHHGLFEPMAMVTLRSAFLETMLGDVDQPVETTPPPTPRRVGQAVAL